jgi:hypothetical protein
MNNEKTIDYSIESLLGEAESKGFTENERKELKDYYYRVTTSYERCMRPVGVGVEAVISYLDTQKMTAYYATRRQMTKRIDELHGAKK